MGLKIIYYKNKGKVGGAEKVNRPYLLYLDLLRENIFNK